MRAVNARSAAAEALQREEPSGEDERLFPEEGPAGGCASGECLPEAAAPEPAPASAPHGDPAAPAAAVALRAAAGGAAEPPAPRAPVSEAPAAAPARPSRDSPMQALTERWRSAVDTVRAASARHGASLAFGRLLWIRPGEVGVAYPAAMGFHRTTVTASAGRTIVERALSEHFGRPTKLVVEQAVDGVGATLSVAEEDQQQRSAHERSTEGKVRSHPAVRAALKFLGGEIEHIQVLEPARPAPPPTDGPEDGS
ncbi:MULTISPECIES: DNA polymerase III subunit gamma/tau [Myxococcaceae]|uniref:DNA polymerase III subunit gamma/tau n=1 Tax=Myxococcaceae TaxID=31 RepID=UPI00188DF631